MKLHVIVFGFICAPSCLVGIPIELPQWVKKIDKVFQRLGKVQREVDNDLLWKQGVQKQLLQIGSQFDTAQLHREQLILCVVNAIRNLNANLITCQHNLLACQANSIAAQSVCDTAITGLQENILDLEGNIDLLEVSIQLIGQQAQATIDTLTLYITSLHDELTSIQDYYADLICIDETKAEALICHINELQKHYYELIANREHLLETIDQYNVSTNALIKNTNGQINRLTPFAMQQIK